MQPIQDKDLDQLFKDTFEDAEIAPSKDLWNSIKTEIKSNNRRVIPVYWLSAALILIISTIGFLVYRQQNSTFKQYANNNGAKKEKIIVVKQKVKAYPNPVVKPIVIIKQTYSAVAKPIAKVVNAKISFEIKTLEKKTTSVGIHNPESIVAKVELPEKAIKTNIEEIILKPKEETVLASNANLVKDKDVLSEDFTMDITGIRNVGDVVNLIVNKVDKRKDKFIQFRTDDDESSVASINIGPFKFGKKNK